VKSWPMFEPDTWRQLGGGGTTFPLKGGKKAKSNRCSAEKKLQPQYSPDLKPIDKKEGSSRKMNALPGGREKGRQNG